MASPPLGRRRFLGLLAVISLPLGNACQQALPVSPTRQPRQTLREQDERRHAPGIDTRGQVVVMLPGDAETLAPGGASLAERTIAGHLFNTLTRRDPRTLRIVPEIVREWRAVHARTWELTVTLGGKFHDGTPADAEAVAYSLERQTSVPTGSPASATAHVRSALSRDGGTAEVEITSATTVRLTTERPVAILPDLLASIELLPPSQYAGDTPRREAATRPVGSGPYRLVEWAKDDRLVLEAFPAYWGAAPSIKTILLKPTPDPAARTLALLAGKADLIAELPPEQIPIIARGAARAAPTSNGRTIVVGMRMDRLPLADPRVRRAFNHALDFDTVNRTSLHGLHTRAGTSVNPPNQPPDARPYPHDPERARALLAEAGWVEGVDGLVVRDGRPFSVVIDVPSGRYFADQAIARAIQQDLRRIGVQVEIRSLDWPTYARDLLAAGNEDDLFLLPLEATFSGQEELRHLLPDAATLTTRWQNDEYARLFGELTSTTDGQTRRELIRRLVTIVREDPPWIAVCRQVDVYGVSRRLAWEPPATEQIRLSDAKLAG